MSYAPKWVLGSICVEIIRRYVNEDGAILAYTSKFSQSLLKKYTDTTNKKLFSICEEMMQFLELLEDDNALEIHNSYIYNTIYFDENGGQRKMKGSFSNALASVSEETSAEQIVKSHKAFVFRLRPNLHLLAPNNWSISEVENMDWLKVIAQQNINISGSLTI